MSPPDSSTPLVRCVSLRHEYRRGSTGGWFSRSRETPSVTALADVSLEVDTGEFVAVMGPSGSGKSTLLHAAAGLLVPTAGHVEFDGDDLAALSGPARTRLRLDRMGVVFQRFHLLPALSARANVALPLVEQGTGRRARRERATELLERVGLGDRVTHRPGELSGGEQQRVAVARALAVDPDLILADEPTGELDTATGDDILALLSELAEDRAVVVSSHDEQVTAVADRVVTLRDGRVVDERRPTEPRADGGR